MSDTPDMSVMSDMIDCPQCGLPAQRDDYYVVGEERVVCDFCGYTHIKTDDGTQASMGYGSVHYVHVNANNTKHETELIRFKAPLNLKARHDVVMKIYDECDINRSSLFVWNENLKELECLHGHKPRTLYQQYQDAIDEEDYYNHIMAKVPGTTDTVDFDEVQEPTGSMLEGYYPIKPRR